MSDNQDKPHKTSILVVDDHAILRQGVAMLINREPDLHVCCEAVDGESAIEANRACPHDLAIVDLSLAGISGLALVKKMAIHFPQLRILMLSMHDESIYAERALQAGAHGYLMKQEAPGTMLQALRQILKGELYVSDRMRTRILQQLVHKNDRVSPISGLTTSEYEIFRMIGQGLGPSKIAEHLNRNVKTIEKHRANIKQKLNMDSSHDLTSFAIQWLRSDDFDAPAISGPT